MPTDRLNFEPPVALPDREHFVIRHAHILSVDSDIGDLENGDIHVRDGSIIAVGRALEADGAREFDGDGMIVTPGFVDAHWHLWSTLYRKPPAHRSRLLRPPVGTCSAFQHRGFLPQRPSCARRSGLGRNHHHSHFSHNTRTSAHADSEIAAHIESGLRGRYSYGHVSGMPPNEIMPIDDLPRVQRDWFSTDGPTDGRLSLGYSLARSSIDPT